MEEDSEIARLPRGSALALPDEARKLEVTAPDGIRLSAQSWGDPAKPAILFVHGFGQCHLSFLKQVRGPLAQSFHLLTFDLRGHGASDKPGDPERYAAPGIWADDIAAVLDAARAETALFVGWSLGGRVAIDYLATHGTHRLAGLNLVGSSISDRPGLRGMGSARLRPLMMDADLSRNIAGTREFLRRCFFVPPDELTFEEMLAYNMLVPPAVRRMVLGRLAHDEAVLRSALMPVLVTHGEKDALASPEGARFAASVFPNGRLSIYPDTGHSPFFEAAERFDRELRAFAQTCSLM
jgi:non-heme chloroperoxidase